MKKLLAILLAACMLLLCACSSGGTSRDPAAGSASSTQATTPTETENSDDSSVTEPAATEPAATEPAATEPAPTETEAPAETDDIFQADLFALGTVTGDVYENTTLGYGCRLEGWTFADANYIAQLNGAASALVSENAKDLLKNSGTFIDMYAASPDSMSSININFQSLEAYAGTGFGEDALIDASLPTLLSELESTGMYSNLSVEKQTAQFAGENIPVIRISGAIQGIDVYQKEVFVLCGDYVATITVSTFLTDGTDAILNCFYKLN